MNENRIIFIMLIFLFFFSCLFSNTIIVDINGSGDYTSIQAGINNATNGDAVLVYPGTYYENINFNGKNITVASKYYTTEDESYIDSTIIDGNENGSVVSIVNGENNAILYGFTITHGSGTNWAYYYFIGGGVYLKNSILTIESCIICENKSDFGAGLQCKNSHINLIDVTIRYNHAYNSCGGIYLEQSTVNFSNTNRCNIYKNYAGNGSDIGIVNSPSIDIIVDTFTVLEPSSDFIIFSDDSTFIDILHAKIEPVNQDLYVSPSGSNLNSGTSLSEPLKNISYALIKIASDSTHPNTIHLSNGVYSPSTNNEKFSLNCRKYISIIGSDEENTILDGEESSNLITCIWYDQNFSVENLTLTNGKANFGGSIYITDNSNPVFRNIGCKNNLATSFGGGIYCGNFSNPIFDNVNISNNSAQTGGGCFFFQDSYPIFLNCSIKGNSALEPQVGGHGGILCQSGSNLMLINTELVDNYASVDISGFSDLSGAGDNPNSYLINCTVSNNSLTPKCNLLANDANLTVINCIFKNYSQDEITFGDTQSPDTVTISYTNIEDSINGINTNNNGTINWGEGNIDQDPLFVGGDPFSYQLSEDSPCIDAGTHDTTGLNLPATDLAGKPRIYNGRVDIGAYEWQDTNSVVNPDTSFINELYLFQNQPNPFKNSTEILFITSDYERVENYTLSIYNTKGQLVRRYEGRANNFTVKTSIRWDGKDTFSREVAPGTYFYKLEYNNNAVVRKMVKVK